MFAHNALNRPTRIVETWYLYRIIRNPGFYDKQYVGAFTSEQAALNMAKHYGLSTAQYEIECIGRGV